MFNKLNYYHVLMGALIFLNNWKINQWANKGNDVRK